MSWLKIGTIIRWGHYLYMVTDISPTHFYIGNPFDFSPESHLLIHAPYFYIEYYSDIFVEN